MSQSLKIQKLKINNIKEIFEGEEMLKITVVYLEMELEIKCAEM